MKAAIFSLSIILSLLTPVLAIGAKENTMEKHHVLNQRQQSIIVNTEKKECRTHQGGY